MDTITKTVDTIAPVLPEWLPLDGVTQAVALWFLIDYIEPNLSPMSKYTIIGANGIIHGMLHSAVCSAQDQEARRNDKPFIGF